MRQGRGYRDFEHLLLKLRFAIANPIREADGMLRFRHSDCRCPTAKPPPDGAPEPAAGATGVLGRSTRSRNAPGETDAEHSSNGSQWTRNNPALFETSPNASLDRCVHRRPYHRKRAPTPRTPTHTRSCCPDFTEEPQSRCHRP